MMNLKNFIADSFRRDSVAFSGGIHPEDMKSYTSGKRIIDLDAPDILVFPMQQHIGAAAKPCVKAGDTVFVGQRIGEAQGEFSANIHSSVSGKVISIEPKLHPNGMMIDSVIIENDRSYTSVEYKGTEDFYELSPKDIISIVKEAGIVGMGGATFPTHIKLSSYENNKIDYVIVNGAECEPYLTSDHRAMLETPEEIIGGLKIIMEVYGLDKGYIAIEANKPDAIEVLKDYADRENAVDIKIVPLVTKYPQGSEKHLIYAVTKRRVPRGKLPKDIGVSVHNIDTCAAVFRAVTNGIPLVKRIVTVGGDCVNTPSNFRVRIGTPMSYLLEKAGGLTAEPKKLIMGGPMMGTSLTTADVPVIKGTSALLAFSGMSVEHLSANQSCLKCGRCVKVCPMRLLPNVLKLHSDNDDFENMQKFNISECVECGSCSYVCPAGQHPVQSIRTGKIKLKGNKAQEAKR